MSGLKARPVPSETSPHVGSAFEQECVALFSRFLHVLGLPKSVGEIYGLLFASPEPLCFAQIVERLGVSKGSVSQGLSFLRQSGAVTVVCFPDDRREYFEPEVGLRRLASGLIREKLQPLTKDARASLMRLRREAARGPVAKRAFQLRRLDQLETWHRQLGRVMPVVQAILSVSRR